jgi:hypothetical protein
MTGLSACAAAADPYAGQQKVYLEQQLQREIDELISNARTYYYAAGCGVVIGSKVDYRLHNRLASILTESGRIHNELGLAGVSIDSKYDRDYLYEALTKQIEDARLNELADASSCDYWHDHPEDVARVRSIFR